MDIHTIARLLAETYRFRQHDHARRAQLKAYQTRALYRLRAHAYTHSPFYARFHRNLTHRPFGELPVLTSEMLMEHFDELVTDRRVRLDDVKHHLSNRGEHERFLGQYQVSMTSDRNGKLGIFLFNQSEWAALLAARARVRAWAGVHLDLTRPLRTALVAPTSPWHMSAQIGAAVHNWWMPEVHLDPATPIAAIVEQLNAWQPEMLVTDVSMAQCLAAEQQAGRLQIAPEHIFTSSEALNRAARHTIEEVWGQRLFDQYATVETGTIAAECDQHRGLHILEDHVIFEVVDERNRPVRLGAEGDKVLITTLFSRTLPLIRYELHDRVRLSKQVCSCGRPLALIETVQGAREDILPDDTGHMESLAPPRLVEIMSGMSVGGWQIAEQAEAIGADGGKGNGN